MVLYRKELFTANSIVSRLRKLLRGLRHRKSRRAALASEVVYRDRISQSAEASGNEDSQPPPTGVVQQDQPSLPPNCSRLLSGDIEILGNHPARSGAFADVWEGSLAGGRVVIKSYRRSTTTDPIQARMRLYKEALACSLLSHKNIVPFRAACTTPEHPLALVYDFMEHRCLREYLRVNGGIRRTRLLADIAQGLLHMHDLGIIHGNLKINDILVDLNGTARIAGLGSAYIPSQNHPTWSEIDAELLFYGTAPELVRPNPLESRIRTTKESDIYAFALLAWELFAGQVPFSNVLQLATIYLLAGGIRPARPPRPELSDQVWNMIQKCWHNDPSRRIPITNVAAILDAEISRNTFARSLLQPWD